MKYLLTLLAAVALTAQAADAAKPADAKAPAKAEAKCDPAKDKNCKVEAPKADAKAEAAKK